jgi:hypothetical protein
MQATHSLYEIEELGEFYIALIPLCNGISFYERVRFFGSIEECRKVGKILKENRKHKASEVNKILERA